MPAITFRNFLLVIGHLFYLQFVFKFCPGECFHSPSRICTSSLWGCIHCAASAEAWCCCTTIPSSATLVLCPGRVSSIPPRDTTALSAKTRTPKSAVGERTKVKVRSSRWLFALWSNACHLAHCLSGLNTFTKSKTQSHLLFPQISLCTIKVSYLSADVYDRAVYVCLMNHYAVVWTSANISTGMSVII